MKWGHNPLILDFIPDISRVAPSAAARRRAMTPHCEYCEWPATQRMRPPRLARRVKMFQHHRPRKPFAHGDNPDPAQAAASRITISDIVAHLVDAEKFS